MSSTPTDIRYIVLSDLHLGQDTSVLTAVTDDEEPTAERTEPALQALMSCLRHLVEQNNSKETKPTLILLGDIIEQAFTNIEVAGPIFQLFVDQWRGTDQQPLFEKVVFIAGNHDHNMWEFTRSYHYWRSLSEPTKPTESSGPAPQPAPVWPPGSHATGLRQPLTGNQDLIGLLINRKLAPKEDPSCTVLPVEICYPTFALGCPSKNRAVLFNHGHYFEPVYQLMSTLLTYVSTPLEPTEPTAESIEQSNFAWLDFFWSTLGRQGKVGDEVERLYDSLNDPVAVENVVKRVLRQVVKNLGNDPEQLGWQIAISTVAKVALAIARPTLETLSSTQEPLSPGTIKTLCEYVKGPLRKQLDSDKELCRADDLTLVFGHTHKPFKNPKDAVYPINVYNTGGWVIDPLIEDEQPGRGGSCVLLNDQLDITSIQFYRQSKAEKNYCVKAESLDDRTDFHRAIADAIKADSSHVFKEFSSAVFKSVCLRLTQDPGR